MTHTLKIAVCQMKVVDDKFKNIQKANTLICEAVENDAEIVILPEMFNCPYENNMFAKFSERVDDGETIKTVSELAKQLGVYIVAGSIPEMDGHQVFNTCFVFGRMGEIIGKHRKMHLFDIEVEGKIAFKESDTLAPGNQVTVVDTEFGKLGIAICYDIRFPELMRIMALRGVNAIIVPAAFNMVTGPAHWEPLLRVRAMDNQVYMVAASPARDENASYIAYGHSMVVDPWGSIISNAKEKEETIYADLDFTYLEKVRRELPLLKHRRADVYTVEEMSGSY